MSYNFKFKQYRCLGTMMRITRLLVVAIIACSANAQTQECVALGAIQNVYQSGRIVPIQGINGSLCHQPGLDQTYTKTCSQVCCNSNNDCSCGNTNNQVNCNGSPSQTVINCWVDTQPGLVYEIYSCCSNYQQNPITNVCEVITTTTESTTTTTTTTTTVNTPTTLPTSTITASTTMSITSATDTSQTTVATTEMPLIVAAVNPANWSSLPSTAGDGGSGILLQGPLLYGIIGAIVFLALVILFVATLCLCCRRRKDRTPDDLSGLESRLRVPPSKIKGKKEDKLGKKNPNEKDVEEIDKKNSKGKENDIHYDIDDATGQVFMIEGPIDPIETAQHSHVVRAVSNDYVALPLPISSQAPYLTGSNPVDEPIYMTIID